MSHPASVSKLDSLHHSLHTPWPGPITAKGRPELHLGMTDPDPADGPVRYLQRLLRDRGYDYVPVNGQFDRLTLAAVKDFQLRQTNPSVTATRANEADGTVVDDATWEALLAMQPQPFTNQPGQPTLAPCPLGTNQHLPPDVVIPGRALLPASITVYQYAHFSPLSATWRNYPFRDDQGQLPQLQMGDADPQGSLDGPIRQLQAFLQDHGYYKGEINGRFDQELHDVVVAYQNSHPSLLSDGVINASDWAQLFREDRQDATANEMTNVATAANVTTNATTNVTANVTANVPPGAAPLDTPLAFDAFHAFDARVIATIVDLSGAPTGGASAIASVGASTTPASDSATEALRDRAPTATEQRPWLRLHATDDDHPNGPIRQLQRLLFVVGQGVPITGIFDVATEQAIRQFQSTFPDLCDPPGEVGPDTWAKLEQEAAKPLDPFTLLEAPASVTDAIVSLPTTTDLNLAWDEPLLVDLAAPPPTHRVDLSPVDSSPVDSSLVDLSLVDLSPVDLKQAEVRLSPATAITPTAVLQKGQMDTAANGPIAYLQTLLNEHGYVLMVNGQFNEATFQAVSNFQYSHDLPPTGVVDRATWEVLMGQDTTDPDAQGSIASAPLPASLGSPEISLPAWDALMADAAMGQTVEPRVEPAVDSADVPLGMAEADAARDPGAVVSPLDVSLPPESMASPSSSAAAPMTGFSGEAVTRSPQPDPLIPSATPPPPPLTLVDLYAQGDATLTASQQQALQWLSQQLPTATLTEFQQRWPTQGSGT